MRPASCGIAVLTGLTVAAGMSAQVGTPSPSRWNPGAAAAYLDHRMDEWFAKGQQLQTGDVRTVCVSCHTVIPYALARPGLRRAMGERARTPQETRLADETSRRVSTFDAHELLYEAEDDKQGQSRGTEAVLYALILAA